MIITASSPWKNKATAQWRNIVISLVFLIGLVASFSAIFATDSATAQINGSDGCTSMTLIGDHQGVQDMRADMEGKAESELGIKDFESQVYNGRNVNQIARQIKSSNLSGRCVIIEAGTGDLKSSRKEIEKSLDSAMKAINASGAKKVFWVSPVVDDARSGKDYSTKIFADALREKSGGKVKVINIQQLSVKGDLFNDNGLTMTEDGYKERVDLIIKKAKPIANLGGKNNDNKSGDNKDSSNNNSGNNSGDSNSGNNSGNNNSGNNNSGNNNSGNNNSGSNSGDNSGNNNSGNNSSGNNNPGDNNSGNNSGGNNSGNSSGSGNNSGGSLEGRERSSGNAESGRGNEDNVVVDGGPGRNVDTQLSSPLAMSKNIAEYGKSNASQFLIVNRWGGFNIASPAFRIDQPVSTGQGSFNSLLSNGLFNLAQFFFSILINGLLLVVGDSVPTLGIKVANAAFALLIGGYAGSKGIVTSIATALCTIAFVFSFMTAIDTKARMTPKQRIMHVGSSVMRVMVAVMAFLFVAYQSSKNHNEDYTSELVHEISTAKDENVDIDPKNTGAENREKTAGDFTSWEPFSLGWFLSLAYFLGNQVASAGFNIGSALVIYPIDKVSTAIDDAFSGNDLRPACDRYVDSVNLAFRGTKFATGSPAISTTLSSLDYTYVRLVIKPYSYLWGGSSFQSGNSYCRDFEQKAGRSAGEMLLMARGAGMWKEAAGSGNIIESQGVSPDKYANGSHISSAATSNLSSGLISGQAGVLVTPEGRWQGDNEYSAMERANSFLKGGKDKSVSDADPGTYYFASCVWTPDSTTSHIDSSMKGVTSMGPAGLSDKDQNLPPYEVEVEMNKYMEESLDKSAGIVSGVGSVGATADKYNEFFDNAKGGGEEAEQEQEEDTEDNKDADKDKDSEDKDSEDKDSEDKDSEGTDDGGSSDTGDKEEKEQEDKDKKKIKIPSPQYRRLNDEDCQNPFVFYLDSIGSEGMSGWNSKSQWAERWDYTPLPPPTLIDSLSSALSGASKDAIENIPGASWLSKVRDTAKSAGEWFSKNIMGNDDKDDSDDDSGDSGDTLDPIDPEDNPKMDPSVALDESVNSSGYNTAKDFWEYRAGYHTDGTTTVVSLIVTFIGVGMIILYIIPVLLLGIVNIVFAIYLMLSGGGLATNLILMAFRSSKPKGAR